MYAHLNGKLTLKKAPWIVLDLGGVGYEIQVPMTTYFLLPEVGEFIFLYTHFTVREDAHTLYGFLEEQEKNLFREMIRVSGIGPKVALSVLSTLPASEFVRIVEEEKLETLIKVPGIGKKTAERLLIELRDRLAKFETTLIKSSHPIDGSNLAQREAIQALISLGYSQKEAKKAVDKVSTSGSCEAILRKALQGFSK